LTFERFSPVRGGMTEGLTCANLAKKFAVRGEGGKRKKKVY